MRTCIPYSVEERGRQTASTSFNKFQMSEHSFKGVANKIEWMLKPFARAFTKTEQQLVANYKLEITNFLNAEDQMKHK